MTLSTGYGRYRLLQCLARGGMAEIWLAQDRGPEGPRLVVVKRILPGLADRRDLAEMFLDEAQLAAHLDHPNVVKIYEHGELDGDSFIAMELIEGENLRTVVRRAVAAGQPGMPLPLAVKAIADAARGLHHAHSRVDAEGRPLGIIHRDVSPQNLLVSYAGRVKVVDFGIAKAATSLTETRTGVLKGKYPYMSPEQVMGRKIDARSDLFSLGVVLWELVCGDRLYRQSTDFLVMQAIVKEPPPPPSSVRADAPRALDALVVRALAKDPRDRFPTSEAFARALDAFLERTGHEVTEQDLSAFLHALLPDRIAVWEKVLAEAAEADPSQGLLDELAAGGGATPAAGSQILSSKSGSRSGSRRGSRSGSGLGSGPVTPPLEEAEAGPEATSATVALRGPAHRPPAPTPLVVADDLPGTRAAPPPGLPREAPPMDDLETRAARRGAAAAWPPSVEIASDVGRAPPAPPPADARLSVPADPAEDASTVAARAAPEEATAAAPRPPVAPPAADPAPGAGAVAALADALPAPPAPAGEGPADADADAGMPLSAPPAEAPVPPPGMPREAPAARLAGPSFSERRAARKAEKAAARRDKQLARVAARQAQRARQPAPSTAPRKPSKKRRPRRGPTGGTAVLRKAATPLVWAGRLAVAAATIGLIIWVAQAVTHDQGLDRHPDALVDPVLHAVSELAGVGGAGTLRIDSEPPGATVRVDGQILGHTPLHQDYTPKRDRVRVELTRRGYRTWRGDIVHARQGIRVDAHLVRRR